MAAAASSVSAVVSGQRYVAEAPTVATAILSQVAAARALA